MHVINDVSFVSNSIYLYSRLTFPLKGNSRDKTSMYTHSTAFPRIFVSTLDNYFFSDVLLIVYISSVCIIFGAASASITKGSRNRGGGTFSQSTSVDSHHEGCLNSRFHSKRSLGDQAAWSVHSCIWQCFLKVRNPVFYTILQCIEYISKKSL